MSKILIAADLHLHRWHNFGYDSDTLLPKRLFDQVQVLAQIQSIVKEKSITVFINGGDLFHSVGNIPVEALNIADKFYSDLNDAGVQCLLVKGNHDLLNRDNPQWFHNSVNIFDNFSDKEIITHDGISIRLVDFHEKIDYNTLVGYDVVVIHQTPVDAKINNYIFKDGVDWKTLSKQNKLVFFAHIHQREKLSDNCYIIGSPMHLNFGDTGTRGVYIIETDDYSVEFLPLMYPEFKTIISEKEITDDYNYYRLVGVDKKVVKDNVVNMITPKVFDERIKSDNFDAILSEWLSLNNKDTEYLEPIKNLLINKSELGRKIFNGKIVRIHIEDFISIGEINYEFKDGFTLITGQNEDLDSNGSGKTSFVDAIYWVLFGETTKGLIGDDVVRRGKSDCNVILDLKDRDNYYLICRSRKHGLSVFRSALNSTDRFENELTNGLKQTDRDKMLESILGFDRKAFLSSCYFSQENLQTLTGLSDSEKTNIVTNLLGFETYDDLYSSVSDKITSTLKITDEMLEGKKDLENEVQNCKNKITIFNKEIASLNHWLDGYNSNLETYKNKISELKNSIVSEQTINVIDYDLKLELIHKTEEDLGSSISNSEREIELIRVEKDEIISEISERNYDMKGFNNTIEDLNREILFLENANYGERCDKCGSIINKNSVDIFVKEKETEINEFNLKIKHIKDHLSILDINKDNIENNLSVLSHNREDLISQLKEAKTTYDTTIKGKFEQDKRIKESELHKSSINSQIDNYLSLIKECEDNINNVTKRVNEQITERDNTNDSILGLDDEIVNIDKDLNNFKKEVEILEFWKNAFSSKGIRGLLLDRFCNQFNSLVNDYLSKASNGEMSIILSPIKILKSGEDRNKLSLEVNINSDTVKYNSLSGGEKRRCDVSLCLALNKWISNRYGLTNGLLGLIIFDEVFSFIDRIGEENIGELLYEEGTDKIVLVISHTPELASYSNIIINIVKKNGVSNLV